MRSRPARRLVPVVCLAAATACDHLVDAPTPAARAPLIEIMLVAGRDSTIAHIGWLVPDASGPTPAAAPEAVLSIGADGGPPAPFRPTSRPGEFLAITPIAPGRAYHLTGTVGGAAVTATTTVPAAFSVAEPTGDRLQLVPSGTTAAGPYAVVPFRWTGPGVAVVTTDSAFVLPESHYTRAQSSQLLVVGRRLRFLGMNRDLDQYLYGIPAPATNITGGFGVLGAALEVAKEVVWQ